MKILYFFIVLEMFLPLELIMGQTLKLSGKIESSDYTSIPYATVALKTDSTIIAGAATDSHSMFVLEGLKPGIYELVISYVGYNTLSQIIEIQRSTDLGTLVLIPEIINIETVTVTAKLPKIRRVTDRFIVNMQNSAIIRGKSALMSLRYAPGVIIDRDGSIVLNGKTGVTVMVNGKKLNMNEQTLAMYLKNMRAEDIDRVEVITNPDARYESEGQGGVIDIYLKKSMYQGINGSVYSTLNQARYFGHNVGTTLNLNYKRLTVTTNFIHDYDKGYSSEKESLNYLSTSDHQQSQEANCHKNHSYSYRAGLQYELNKRTLIGFDIYGAHQRDTINSLSTVSVIPVSGIDSTTQMDSYSQNKNTTTTYSFNYIYTIARNQTVTILADYTTINQNDNNRYEYNNDISPQINFRKRTEGKSGFDIYTTQLDYSHPFGQTVTLALGTKSSWTHSTINEQMENCQLQNWQTDPLYTFNYKTNEYLGAAYSNFSWKIKKFSGSAGLRGEYNRRKLVKTTDHRFELFPSVMLKLSPTDKLYYTLSYRRRINRAPYRSLVPFYDFNSPFSVTIGNPELTSSPVDAFSFSTGYSNYSISVSYDYIKDMIYPISTYDSQTGITYTKNANTKSGHNFNIDITLPFSLTKWWDVFNNISLQYRRFKDERFQLNTKNKSFKAICINNLSLPGNYNFEVDLIGMTPSMAGPMIRQQGGVMIDLALSKDFFKEQLGVSLGATDLTGVLSNLKETTHYNGFTTISRSNANERKVSLSIRYNFNTGRKFKARINSTSQSDEKARTKDL